MMILKEPIDLKENVPISFFLKFFFKVLPNDEEGGNGIKFHQKKCRFQLASSVIFVAIKQWNWITHSVSG